MRDKLGKMIPGDINCFVEVFAGGAWMTLSHTPWAKVEILNDTDEELTNLYKCAKFHVNELRRCFEGLPKARSFFYEMKDTRGLTDIQRAVRFYYLTRFSFGAKGQHFGTGAKSGGKATGSFESCLKWIQDAQKRLDRVTIENLDFAECIEKYDRPGTFFFCDPPYVTGVNLGFNKYDHHRLADVLARVRARWLLTYDDVALVRRLYSEYRMEKASHVKRINNVRGSSQPLAQLIIRNYSLRDRIAESTPKYIANSKEAA